MSETFEGRLRVSAWQDGSRAWIATSAGEIPVLGEAVFERLFRYVFPPFGGEQTFENARIQGERGPKGIHKVVLLVIKTTFIEAHVRGEDRAALLSERTKDDHVGDTFEGHFRAWENGRAYITTSDGEIAIRDHELLERLFCAVFATSDGDAAYDARCVVHGERGAEGIHLVDVLVIKTEFVDIHVRGSFRRPGEDSFERIREREFFDALTPSDTGDKCSKTGCDHTRINLGSLCRRHHFETVLKKPCPFEDE